MAKRDFAFGKENFILIAIAIVFIVVYLPDIGVWTGETGEEGFLPVFQTPEHSPAP